MSAVEKMQKKFWGFLSNLNASLDAPCDFYRYNDSMSLISRNMDEHPNADAIIKRPGMSVYLNPDFLSFSKFKEKVHRTDKRWEGRPGRYENCLEGASAAINPLCGIGDKDDPASYGEFYSDLIDDGEWYARRKFCLVGLRADSLQVMGHAGLTTSITVNANERTVHVFVQLDAVWVAPRWRGLAVGSDIIFSAQSVFGDLYENVARELPEGWELWSTVHADYESFGGKKMTEHIYGELAVRRDILVDDEATKAELDTVGLDAGF